MNKKAFFIGSATLLSSLLAFQSFSNPAPLNSVQKYASLLPSGYNFSMTINATANIDRRKHSRPTSKNAYDTARVGGVFCRIFPASSEFKSFPSHCGVAVTFFFVSAVTVSPLGVPDMFLLLKGRPYVYHSRAQKQMYSTVRFSMSFAD